jgi:hypothetical protein
MPNLTAYPEQPTQPPHDGPNYAPRFDADALRDAEVRSAVNPPNLHLDRQELAKARVLRLIAESKVMTADLNAALARLQMPGDDDEANIRIAEADFASARRAIARIRSRS